MKILPLFAVVIVLALSPLSVARAYDSPSSIQDTSGAKKTPYDVQFLSAMIEHHREGIKMFEMAAKRAQNPEVKDMGQKMADDQEKEISELKDMRDQIQPDAPETVNMKLPGMKPMDMGKLEGVSGNAFDREFLNMTIMHHKGAVAMTDDAMKHAHSPQVKVKAKQMHDAQKEEIAHMRGMLKDMNG